MLSHLLFFSFIIAKEKKKAFLEILTAKDFKTLSSFFATSDTVKAEKKNKSLILFVCLLNISQVYFGCNSPRSFLTNNFVSTPDEKINSWK